MEEDFQQDICRVCRSEGCSERPLFHPCICTGSIKFVHQECLTQWLRYSRKEYCELCNHRFSFTPIYSPDMPSRLPLRDVVAGLVLSVITAARFWLHYTMVACAWLCVVPLLACRIYRCLFAGSVTSILSLPLDLISPENVVGDCLQGCLVVTCTLCAFICLVWVREQIMLGGGPEWLELEQGAAAPPQPPAQARAAAVPAAEAVPVNRDGEAGGSADRGDDGGGGGGGDARDAADGAGHGGDLAANQPRQAGDGGAAEEEPPAVAAGDADENNWNPMDWDRAADDLTWERLLGLDGSLAFLEHVFWVVSLNTLFILVFAFCPYHIGHFSVVALGIQDSVLSSHFEGLLTTLVGYCVVGLGFIVLHTVASALSLGRAQRVLGVCYVVVKVSMLAVIEIGLFPLICGWWLDVCSLQLLGTTLQERQASFQKAPGTCMFWHWLMGTVYVFYFASFMLLLREVLRPGALWFLRNLNDPDFNPIQDMIHLPVPGHARRFLVSVLIFGTTVLLMLWLPVRAIKHMFPGFLPYNIVTFNDSPTMEPSLQIMLLQVFMPVLLEQDQAKVWLKDVIRLWCVIVAKITGLGSYLLGDTTADTENKDGPARPMPAVPPRAAPGDGGVGVAHQAMLMQAPAAYQPYRRPPHMGARVALLLFLVAVSLAVTSVALLTVPVWLGRRLLAHWLNQLPLFGLAPPDPSPSSPPPPTTTDGVSTLAGSVVSVSEPHEIYTASCGLFCCWLVARNARYLSACSWLAWRELWQRVTEVMGVVWRLVLGVAVMYGLVPLMYGRLLELVVMPFRVAINQTAVFFPLQNWALGILYMKITFALTLMGPNWWLKSVLERTIMGGFWNIDVPTLLRDLAAPLVTALGLALSLPYILVHSVMPLFVSSSRSLWLMHRNVYPFVAGLCCLAAALRYQCQQFRRLYEHIKNDKYLVGRRLVNYDPVAVKSSTQPIQHNSAEVDN